MEAQEDKGLIKTDRKDQVARPVSLIIGTQTMHDFKYQKNYSAE